jgi:hypothetical protein
LIQGATYFLSSLIGLKAVLSITATVRLWCQ